jgi:hypothetical protein
MSVTTINIIGETLVNQSYCKLVFSIIAKKINVVAIIDKKTTNIIFFLQKR